ncbi:putative ubiquitin interaction domain-containing protein [Eutypa lata UCREL1]|uniref:Putative ubiquitin interaction domain-containing protein n=1 Tax=Eutypa lata (strain UCR-EL1) TaxID=1287681 RepID=M7SI51_EUTLA|nr:putative ubiquitin interaction domain-containing protein [Eutypa lata UCREL1]
MSGNGAPSEDDVSLFCLVTSCSSRTEAIARLRANNNNVEQATGDYFDNPDSTKYKWDESQFSAGRDGDYSSANVFEGAPTNHAEEDAALRRALAESAAESGIPAQQSGVIDTGSAPKHFGPANRSEYDSAQWAMVPTKAATEVTDTDPKPSMRKRQPGTPAFIRQTKDGRLGSLLSIYHKIPLVRNILLSFPDSARTYGHNSEWWKGQPILKPEVLAAMARGEQVSGDDGHPAFSEELHRLMAFLDNTDRSYATVDALTETTPLDQGPNTCQPHDIRECRQKIIEAFGILIDQQRKNAQWRYYDERWNKDIPYSMNDLRLISTWAGPYELTAEEEAKQKRWDLIIQTAKNELEQLEQDIAVCHEKKEEFMEMLEVISKRLTCQEHEAADERFVYRSNPEVYHPEYWNPSQKYSLRGVALSDEVTYVCIRGETDLIDMGEESNPNDQWWKIDYSSKNPSPATVEKVSLDSVLEAASTGSKWPILVYATQKAIDATPIPLSDPLRMFVKADNRSLQQELTQEQNQEQTPQEPLPLSTAITDDTLSRIPTSSPAKRKHSASSSVATNGSSRDGLDDVDLTFTDDHFAYTEESEPITSHQEFASGSSPQSSKLGGIVESFADCQTNERGSPHRRLGNQPHGAEAGAEVEMVETVSSGVAAPEMQERAGRPVSFFSPSPSPNNTAGGTIDLMDMDIDSDHHGSQP